MKKRLFGIILALIGIVLIVIGLFYDRINNNTSNKAIEVKKKEEKAELDNLVLVNDYSLEYEIKEGDIIRMGSYEVRVDKVKSVLNAESVCDNNSFVGFQELIDVDTILGSVLFYDAEDPIRFSNHVNVTISRCSSDAKTIYLKFSE